MQINIKYFGILTEDTGCNEEKLSFSGVSINDLKRFLFNKYPNFIHKDFRIAQDQELVSDDTAITGREIAVLPPFAGG